MTNTAKKKNAEYGLYQRQNCKIHQARSQLGISLDDCRLLAKEIGGKVLHLLVAHPTPPVFDGAEDRNGRRNFDEVRLWADYISGGKQADYLADDQGRRGGLEEKASFVIVGDLNADPVKGAADYGRTAISQHSSPWGSFLVCTMVQSGLYACILAGSTRQ